MPREYVQLSNRQKLNHRKIARLNDNLHAKTKRIEQLETDVDNLIIVLNRMTMKLSRLKEKGLQVKTTKEGKQKWSVWDKKMNELNQKFDRYSADYAKLATIMVFNKADQSALEDLTERVNALHRNIVTLRTRLDKQSQTEKNSFYQIFQSTFNLIRIKHWMKLIIGNCQTELTMHESTQLLIEISINSILNWYQQSKE